MIKVQWDLLWCISVSVKVFDLEQTSRPSSWLFYYFFCGHIFWCPFIELWGFSIHLTAVCMTTQNIV